MTENVLDYIGGAWQTASTADTQPVINPASAQTIAEVTLAPAETVAKAVEAGQAAFEDWRRVPVVERVQSLFKLKMLLEAHQEDIARTITEECGKTLKESIGELRRGIENVEVACGMPSLMQGYTSEDIARGIDEHMVRQPLGVVTAITPFNFPGMIPLWFLPYAVATGNSFILKPSERVPLTTRKLFNLIDECDFPPGVLQLVNGGKETVNALLDHPGIKAVSFVGSTPVAKHVYSRATANGKRAQCQGGAFMPVATK